jgi:hypothetical protein
LYQEVGTYVKPVLIQFFLIRIVVGGVESKLGPLGTAVTYGPIVQAPGDDGEIGGMMIGRVTEVLG